MTKNKFSDRYSGERKKSFFTSKWFILLLGLIAGGGIAAALYKTSVYFSTDESCMMCHVHPHVEGSWTERSLPVYTTSYVMLARKEVAAEFFREEVSLSGRLLEGRRLMVPDVFRKTDDYDVLLDSLRGSNLFLTSRNSFDLMEELGGGKYDLLICEKSEAQLHARENR